MEALRQIPPINDILQTTELTGFRKVLQTAFGSRTLDDVIDETRRQLAAGSVIVPRTELTSRIAKETARRLTESFKPSLRRVINGSGVVLHTNLGRAPLPASAIDHLNDIATG